MFPEAALHMLFAGQLPHASDLTMATFALVSDVETTMAVSFSMLHTSFLNHKLENHFARISAQPVPKSDKVWKTHKSLIIK
jgi:hypothetical protein